ncbi:hypothetical protein ACO34A_05125 [Rhizobium sp. ACO-34A]|nr:DUF1476 domain-containing protein [Rhizobium sp. ACO-34A]ATN33183.1 hypothetical protein ACO34A_05125 [Rhizobium sp. ACO-34A]
MNNLQQRARAFEDQYAHQQEMLFKAEVRRNVLIGKWAAEAMGRTDGEAYARELALTQVNEPHRLLERLRRDFEAAGVEVKEEDIQSRMLDMLHRAAEELHSNG